MPTRFVDPDQFDSLHVEIVDRERVADAIHRVDAGDGFVPAEHSALAPHGHRELGDEDPAIRRYLVSPPCRGWTGVLPSQTDWDRTWSRRVAEYLDCRAAYLMLHDGDVFTVDLFDGDRSIISYVSSPDYFDLPARDAEDLGVDLDALLGWCPPDTDRSALRAALAPPGRIDVDGGAALEATAALLGLEPERTTLSYGLALQDDGLEVRGPFEDHLHLAFRGSSEHEESRGDEEPPPSDAGGGGVVVPFPSRRG